MSDECSDMRRGSITSFSMTMPSRCHSKPTACVLVKTFVVYVFAARGAYRRDHDRAARGEYMGGSRVRRLLLVQWQRRDDWPTMAGGVGYDRRGDRHQQYSRGGCGARC